MRGFARTAIVFAAVAVLFTGCKRGRYKVDEFVLDAATARKAVEATLDSWKGGNKPDRITSHSPPIDIFDSKWRDGAKITGYQITGEDTITDGNHRRLSVKLTLPGGATEEAHYIVFGKTTLSVYREEDFNKLKGM